LIQWENKYLQRADCRIVYPGNFRLFGHIQDFGQVTLSLSDQTTLY